MEMKIINKIVVVLFSILLPPLVLMAVFMCVWVFENMFMSRGKEITAYYAPQILSDTMTFCYMDGDAYLFFGGDGKCQRSDSSDYIRFRYSRFSSVFPPWLEQEIQYRPNTPKYGMTPILSYW